MPKMESLVLKSIVPNQDLLTDLTFHFHQKSNLNQPVWKVQVITGEVICGPSPSSIGSRGNLRDQPSPFHRIPHAPMSWSKNSPFFSFGNNYSVTPFLP